MRIRRSYRGVLVSVLTVVTLAGLVGVAPAGGSVPLRRPAAATKVTTYVGRVASLDASLAVVTDGKHAFAYLCDSAGLSEWFRGDASKKTLNLESASGAQLAIGLDGKKAGGVVLLADGTTADVELRQATGDAGLFREERVIDGVGYAAGWVVLPDGDVDGEVSLANVSGARVLAAPLPSSTVTPSTEVVGVVAPAPIAEQFPPTPPAETQVTVVPFSATTTQAGTGVTATTSGSGGGVVTTTQPELTADQISKNKQSCKGHASFTKGQINVLQTQLNAIIGEGFRARKKRQALQEQVNRLRATLSIYQSGTVGC